MIIALRHSMNNLWNGIDNIISNEWCLGSKFSGEPSNPSSNR